MLLRFLMGALILVVGCAGPGVPATPKPAGGAGTAPSAPIKAPGPYTPNGEVDGSSGRVSLAAMDTMKWSPNTITKVKPGQQVSIEVKNNGATLHSVVAPGMGLANKVPVNPGQTATATFAAPSVPGTYMFWCPEPGHAESGMVGEVVVQ